MRDVLYIDCCIRRELSRTRTLAEAFLAALARRGGCAIERLTLMDEPLLPFRDGFFFQRERLLNAGALTHPRFRYAHRFSQADAVVLAAPFWDLSFPALLKTYIEHVSVQGITFDCDEKNGCFGICKAKRMVFLTTRGGAMEGSPMDNGTKYMRDMAAFFGIPRFDCIAADGLDLGIEPPERILAQAVARAETLAGEF